MPARAKSEAFDDLFSALANFVRARLAELSTILTLVAGAVPAALGVPAPYSYLILVAAAMQAMVPSKNG